LLRAESTLEPEGIIRRSFFQWQHQANAPVSAANLGEHEGKRITVVFETARWPERDRMSTTAVRTLLSFPLASVL